MAYRLAALAIGLVVGAYWLRVLKMARKARKKTGRAANFLPPEMVGRVLRVVWIPVVVVWVVHPFFTAAVRSAPLPLRPVYGSAWIAWPAAACAGLCFWASRACWKAMGKHWRMGIDPNEQNALVVAGPYAYVRHPIYALSQAMMVMTMVAIPSPLFIAAGFAHVLLLQWEARREESHLRGLHGPKYDEYCAGVGRFIPRLRRV